MGDIARQSELDESVMYKALGVNAELLIDHAWGWEPTDIATIKSYKPETNSLFSRQVLMEPYDSTNGRLIVQEMTELLALDLVRKGLVTKRIELTIGYDRTSIEYEYKGQSPRDSIFRNTKTGKRYSGKITLDPYGRPLPYYAHGTGNIDRWTSSAKRIMEVMLELYDRIIDPSLMIRRVNVVACDLIPEDKIPSEAAFQMDLFTDYEALEKKKSAEAAEDRREKNLQKATLLLQEKFGKNAVLKGMNLKKGAMFRNGQIGGHRAE